MLIYLCKYTGVILKEIVPCFLINSELNIKFGGGWWQPRVVVMFCLIDLFMYWNTLNLKSNTRIWWVLSITSANINTCYFSDVTGIRWMKGMPETHSFHSRQPQKHFWTQLHITECVFGILPSLLLSCFVSGSSGCWGVSAVHTDLTLVNYDLDEWQPTQIS